MIATALLLALAGAPATGSPVLARVDSVQITRADVTERLRVLRTRRRASSPSAVVADLVDEALLAGEARRTGLDRDPEVTAALDAQRRRLAVDALTARMAGAPSESTLRDLYHQTADTARLVLAKVASEEEARALRERVRKGAELAVEARHSADPALAAQGGDTGLVARAALDPALAAEVFRAGTGDVVGPVPLRLGWAVARVVERNVADEAGFAARRKDILAFATEQARAQAKAHALEQLGRKAGVKLDEKFLETVGRQGQPTPEDLDHPIAMVNGRPLRYGVIHRKMASLGSSGRTHGMAAARVGFARAEIERLLLEEEAIARGLDRSPDVLATLPAIERNILAGAAAAKLTGRPNADLTDPMLRDRIASLRAAAKVTVDESAIAAIGAEGRAE